MMTTRSALISALAQGPGEDTGRNIKRSALRFLQKLTKSAA